MAKYYGEESYFNEHVTFYKDVNVQGNLNYDSLTVRNLTVREQSTLGITTSTSLSSQNLSVFNVSTLGIVQVSAGIITATSGITTYYGDGSNLTVNGSSLSSFLLTAVPAGTVISYASSTAPTGYLKCNGSAISRSTYSSLFSGIGTVFGDGDGSTTFNVPDLRGEFVRGWDDGRSIDTGRAFGSSQSDAFKSHNHTSTQDLENPNSSGITQGAGGRSHGVIPSGTVITNPSGGTETRPRNLSLMYCIKY
jgi:microcystin-dependent protein